jgi:DNA-binding GntR family transcriptional regulator
MGGHILAAGPKAVNAFVDRSVDTFPDRGLRWRVKAKPAKSAKKPEAASSRDIFEALRRRIGAQQAAPGSKLRETELADEFGVPRARVRDALAALERRGLVERVPNRGAVVARLDLPQIFHIYDLREVLEALAARLATQNKPREYWKAELEHFKGPMKEHIARGEFDAYIERYEKFRRRIIEAAANPLLAEMLDNIYEKTQVLIRRTIILPGRAEVGRRQHVAMLEAMCRGDAAEAERLRRAGLRSARESVEQYQRYIL